MKDKIIWVLVLLIQLNFYLSWIFEAHEPYIETYIEDSLIKSYVIGSAISYGLLSVLILRKRNSSKNVKNKILPQILLLITCSITGALLLGLFSIIIPAQILNLVVLFTGLIYTSIFVFKSNRVSYQR
jgi:hypothetical protein